MLPPTSAALWEDRQDLQPLRGELFSAEHLRSHAGELAQSLTVIAERKADGRFQRQLRDIARELRQDHAAVAESIRAGKTLTPDVEWLLDNFHIVEEHLHEIYDDLPPKFFRELPKLADGVPRTYHIAQALIVHTDSVVQQEELTAFLMEYQRVSPLTIGELWSLPIMLRLTLVENLRRLAGQMVLNLDRGAYLKPILQSWRAGDGLPEVYRTESVSAGLIASTYAVLRELFPDDAARYATLEQLMMDRVPNSTELVRDEHRRQAANQVSIGNVITSMRLISALDWTSFFEAASLVEQTLRRDPSEVYSTMDPESRDRYRHAVEDLAKRTHQTDLHVAELALARAEGAANSSDVASTIRSHVGYWLVDDGRAELERELEYRPNLLKWLQRGMRAHPELTYFGLMSVLLALGLAATLRLAWLTHVAWPAAALLTALAVFPLSEFVVSLVNLIVTHILPPHILPKLELKDGVPRRYRTFVVVPALLSGRKEIAALLERLELHYVSNPEPELRFALLTDFTDAETENLETDAALVELAVAGIKRLNAHYGSDERSPFYLFHRARRWNASEGVWMGWERKRGKLMEFNQLLHRHRQTSYVVQEGDLSALETTGEEPAFPFVITLDADTQLPLGAARRMIGTLAHPLNRPQLDERQTCVAHGYVILQPRVSVKLEDGNKTRFTQLFANGKGIDVYATAASDVYQDLFGEGSYTGKGIYDVRAFEQTLAGAFGENQILSHDLIEGCHARVALVSDIEVIDGFPVRYDANARRSHRWVRGDWQILPWIWTTVPCETGCRDNRLSLLSRWKIVDNLRRSLTAPFTCLFLIATWFLAPHVAALWSLIAWAGVGFPVVACLAEAAWSFPRREYWNAHLRAAAKELWKTVLQTAVSISCLLHKGWLMSDAIVRAVFRMAVTRRRMLEWETASATERRLAKSRWSVLQHMGWVPVFVAIVAVCLPRPSWPAAAPWLLAWFVSPFIAHIISQPLAKRKLELSAEEKRWLRQVARNTWTFFETRVNEQTHALPPDNLQEYPEEKLAERVSPTNEGLYLVSALVARDFGFLSLHRLAERWEQNLATWSQLPKLHGHFYNWYETSNLQALRPRYVSTVDSGNLAASLLVIRRGVDDLVQSPVFGDAVWDGLHDTVSAAIQACESLQPRGAHIVSAPLDNLTEGLRHLDSLTKQPPKSWKDRAWSAKLLQSTAVELKQKLAELLESRRHPTADVEIKIHSLLQWIADFESDFKQLADWVEPSLAIRGSESLRLAAGSAQSAWNRVEEKLDAAQSLEQLIQLPNAIAAELAELKEIEGGLSRFTSALQQCSQAARSLKDRLQAVGQESEQLALEMDFTFLFNPQRRLFAIGYNLEEGELDRSHYDMLCSEARISSHFAIAKGDVSYKHWFALARQATHTAGRQGLLSWGGSMFEFLMPPLFQRCPENSLLAEACETAVLRQQEYGRQRGVPWGVSESAFASFAVNRDYHYKSFGVPGLGLKRGLSDDLVVAPYAAMLSLTFAPKAVVSNLHQLDADGGLGHLGFYDAVDYTPNRVPVGRRSLPVRCYMAHHQAMSLMAMANVLLDQVVVRRFHSHPLIHATEMLLEEAVPAETAIIQPHQSETVVEARIDRPEAALVSRRMIGHETPAPRTHFLSNGTYSVMVTNTGGGYSRWREIAVNRWRPDLVQDQGGHFFYIRDRATSQVWSAAYQPTGQQPDFYEVIFSIDKAEYRRRDGDIETHLEIAVSPDDQVEIRQLKITNHGWRRRELEITSYAEVVLTTPAADAAHPAFHKLFVETEYIAEETALLAKRRPRESSQEPLWAVHVLACNDVAAADVQFESSREKFLGRNRNAGSPAALDRGVQLSGTTGFVLDPVFSLRCAIPIESHASVTLAFTTGVATSRDEALRLADQFHELRSVQRAFELAWVFNQVQLHHLHITAAEAQRFQQLAAFLLFPQSQTRGPETSLRANRLGQNGLWRFGVSGDRPILLVKVAETEHLEFLRKLLLAHAYWIYHGMAVDLVIMNTHPGSYLDELQEQLQQLVQDSARMEVENKSTVFLLRAAQLRPEEIALLDTAAQVVLEARRGWSIISNAPAVKPVDAAPKKQRVEPPETETRFDGLPTPRKSDAVRPHSDTLEYWNGIGGFAEDGREYHIRSTAEAKTPAPWSNVIANPRFGTLVTETGGGYTWAGNSRQNKLTTWSNDPVTDPPSEVLYLRDDSSQAVWTPLSSPQQRSDEGWVHHGQGYTRFLRTRGDLEQEILISIAPDDPVKFVCVKLRNRGQTERRLSATYYAELVLGVGREQTQMYLITEAAKEPGTLLVRNAFHATSSEQVAFLKIIGPNGSATGDRLDFIGRNNSLENPAALQHRLLAGKTGAGLDPCAAVQTQFAIRGGEQFEIVFLLGCGANANETQTLVDRYATLDNVHQALRGTTALWDSVLNAVEVATPNKAFDLLVNRWLPYQVLSCRLWGRSAFYQSGGAYGFRDQLQDVMALVYSRPDLVREQILRAAARQFEAGDVQHWWHPPDGEGTRTRFSDDLLWLPFVVAQYLDVTGDQRILDETIPFLHSAPLAPEEQERYERPQVSQEQATLYEHCLRTIERGFRVGTHGLPLMGCGDWNDGMNLVGAHGKGESVWVGWFLLVLVDQFLPICRLRGNDAIAERYRQKGAELRDSLEQTAWDGRWYRRAFFDDGTPLGSAQNDECQIDSIVQSWAVLANADAERTDQALQAVFQRLVSNKDRVVALFAPPFDRTSLDPGYIKGYVPGVRENGGQYTHAVLWLIRALTEKGDSQRAAMVFDFVNPILHTRDAKEVERYRAEPYVLAADVYMNQACMGRAGWTWYTGSASWAYRTALESILGLTSSAGQVRLQPCVPAEWNQFKITLRVGKSTHHFVVNLHPESSNGHVDHSSPIKLIDDGRVHQHRISIESKTAVLSPSTGSTVVHSS